MKGAKSRHFTVVKIFTCEIPEWLICIKITRQVSNIGDVVVFTGRFRSLDWVFWGPEINGLLPGKSIWNLNITQSKRKIIFQIIIFRFHVNFWGCILGLGTSKNGRFEAQIQDFLGQWASDDSPRYSNGYNLLFNVKGAVTAESGPGGFGGFFRSLGKWNWLIFFVNWWCHLIVGFKKIIQFVRSEHRSSKI